MPTIQAEPLRRLVSAIFAKATKTGGAMVSLRHLHHLGRIGDWVEYCTAKRMVSVHFVNAVHLSWIVAPFGGNDDKTWSDLLHCAGASGLPDAEVKRLLAA